MIWNLSQWDVHGHVAGVSSENNVWHEICFSKSKSKDFRLPDLHVSKEEQSDYEQTPLPRFLMWLDEGEEWLWLMKAMNNLCCINDIMYNPN